MLILCLHDSFLHHFHVHVHMHEVCEVLSWTKVVALQYQDQQQLLYLFHHINLDLHDHYLNDAFHQHGNDPFIHHHLLVQVFHTHQFLHHPPQQLISFWMFLHLQLKRLKFHLLPSISRFFLLFYRKSMYGFILKFS